MPYIYRWIVKKSLGYSSEDSYTPVNIAFVFIFNSVIFPATFRKHSHPNVN